MWLERRLRRLHHVAVAGMRDHAHALKMVTAASRLADVFGELGLGWHAWFSFVIDDFDLDTVVMRTLSCALPSWNVVLKLSLLTTVKIIGFLRDSVWYSRSVVRSVPRRTVRVLTRPFV